MKKSRIFMTTAALTLAFAGFIAAKATKKFTAPSNLYINPSSWTPVLSGMSATSIFTTVSNSVKALMSDSKAGTTPRTLYTYSGSVYLTVYNTAF